MAKKVCTDEEIYCQYLRKYGSFFCIKYGMVLRAEGVIIEPCKKCRNE